jgi:hypothetical protein
MKVYKFIFFIGLLNLGVSFMGIPFVYKQYIIVSFASLTIAYALILRAIAKEKEYLKREHAIKHSEAETIIEQSKTIEEVIEMKEQIIEEPIKSKTKLKKRMSREQKILVASGFDHE